MKKKVKLIHFYGLFVVLVCVSICVFYNEQPVLGKSKVVSKSKKKKHSKKNLEVHFINVGLGDAMLIIQGNDAMMIDFGSSVRQKHVYNYVKKQNIKKLKYAILTHPHGDHMGGMLYQLRRLKVKRLLCTKDTSSANFYRKTMDYIYKKSLSVVHPRVGNTYKIGKAKIKVIGALRSNYDRLNDRSLVIKLTYGSTSFLLVGDQESVAEADMVEKYGTKLHADVLKVAHHGSLNASSDEFLKYVHPKYAVISVSSSNKYGFPHQETLDRLKFNNIKVYRTDRDGAVVAISDGKKIKWEKSKNPVN